MHADLTALLCCPACQADLRLTATDTPQPGVVLEGMLTCVSCGAGYPILRGVPRFVTSHGPVGSFSYEWNRWSRVQLDVANGTSESEDTLREKTGFGPGDFAGRVVLDVGCGAGRFLDVAARWGARVVGVDLSFAVDAAQANAGGRSSVDVVQADIFALPFKRATFDIIFSIGVLHHTPDTRKAFLALPPLLRRDGQVAVWLYYYTDAIYRRATDVWRTLLRPLPHRLLYAWCWMAVSLLSRRPLLTRRPWSLLARLVPVSTHPDFSWRVLDTFDWYSPRYQDKACSAPRVVGWFREAGLSDIEVFDCPTAVRGSRRGPDQPLFRQPLLDVRQRRILIFGAGAGGTEAFDALERAGLAGSVVAVCDNDPAKQGRLFHGHAIRPFDSVARNEYDVALVTSQPGRIPISAQLRRAGLVERVDFATTQYVTQCTMPLLVS